MRRTRAVLASLGAVTVSLAVVSAGIVAADAAGPYVVKVGTHTTGSYSATAATIGASPQINFKDVTSGTALSCGSGTANAKIKAGTNATGAGIGTIPSSSFTNCTGPLNLNLVVTQTKSWTLNATGPVTAGGIVPAKIAGVGAHVAATPNASQCNFDVTGAVNGQFAQKPATSQQLRLKSPAGTLKVSNVVGCFGLVNNGDKASFNATYEITSPSGTISIANG